MIQDAFDIITGGYVAKKGGIPPLTDTRPLIMRTVSEKPALYHLTNLGCGDCAKRS